VPGKRLLYITALQATAYRWQRGVLAREAAFGADEEGIAAFSEYVAAAPRSLFYALVDVVEEDFFQENIPYVRGGDRRVLLARKLAQRYRDTSLSLALSLGTEAGERREERILYSSFTNTQQLEPWLAALRANEARVASVSSVALATPLVARRIGFKASRYLLVSLQQGGLRQSFVDNGCIRFSRLGRIDHGDPVSVAQACAAETERFQQYLTSMRMLPRDAAALDVVVLAPGKYQDIYRSACADNPRLRFHVLDLAQAGRGAGLKSAPAETLAEGLFLHVLASSGGEVQFADDGLRRFYDLWRARVGLVGAGAAAFALCLAFSAVTLFNIHEIDRRADLNQQLEAVAAAQYARTQASFPKTPTSAENMKIIVKNFRSIERQNVTPDTMLAGISRALADIPQLELEKIDWEIGTLKTAAGGREGAKATPAPASAPGAGAEAQYQVVELSGRLLLTQASDYRNITQIVSQFVAALRAQPGMEVVSTRLPFDITAEKSVSGDVGVQRSAEVPRFSVIVSRRLGT